MKLNLRRLDKRHQLTNTNPTTSLPCEKIKVQHDSDRDHMNKGAKKYLLSHPKKCICCQIAYGSLSIALQKKQRKL